MPKLGESEQKGGKDKERKGEKKRKKEGKRRKKQVRKKKGRKPGKKIAIETHHLSNTTLTAAAGKNHNGYQNQ